MSNRRSATLNWIVLWGIIAIMANLTLTTAGSWSAIGAAIFSFLGIAYGTIKWLLRKHKLKNPFEVYYEPKPDTKEFSYIVDADSDSRQLQATLSLNTALHVIFISLKFVGDGKIPTINKLYDWRRIKLRGVDIDKTEDGTWYWTPKRSVLRHPRARIRIGIEYIAANSFDGELKIELNAEEKAYIGKTLVFKVRDKNKKNY